jgi:hypothetical protein
VIKPSAPDGSTWRLRKTPSGWQALLRVPGPDGGGKLDVKLEVWAPYRDEPALIKDLIMSK